MRAAVAAKVVAVCGVAPVLLAPLASGRIVSAVVLIVGMYKSSTRRYELSIVVLTPLHLPDPCMRTSL